MNDTSNNKLVRKLNWYATQKGYTLRDTQKLLVIDGFKRPSLYFILKYFRKFRGSKGVKKLGA